jgi:ubiquinone/menaquinone biosynthesis C-methylase UbiE
MPERPCPVWVGYFLASPLRKLLYNPERILSPFVSEGMTVLDIGCAMGFFSIPLARMVGPKGKVICVDVQEKMLETLMKRARKAGVADRIETRLINGETYRLDDLAGTVDFALVFAVLHEMPDTERFFGELYPALKPAGMVLAAEPSGHIVKEGFMLTVAAAQGQGFMVLKSLPIRRSLAVVMGKRI